MSGECERYSEHAIDCRCHSLPDRMIDAVIRLGRAQQFLKTILDNELFDNLNNRDTKWKSKHDKEDELLDNTRRSLSCLSDNLWSLMCILQPEIDA